MNMNSWCLDIHSGDIYLDGKKIARLSASETSVLGLLVSNEGALLSKEQLLDEGWPNKVVSPSSVTVAIKNIRKALCASGTLTYIETVHRKGYIYHGGGTQFSIKEKYTIGNDIHNITSSSPVDEEPSTVAIQATDNIGIKDVPKASVYSTNKVKVISKRPLNYGIIVGLGAYSIVYLFFLCLAIFIFLSKKDLVCYQVEQANVCGRFKLDAAALNDIKSQLNDKSGDYLYGYTKNLDDIKIYKRH